MKIDQLKVLASREPFRPFSVNLLNGDRLFIENTAALLFPIPRPELVIAFTQDGRMHIFEEQGMVSVSELREKVL
jgi:hypothetical protein